MMKRLADRLLLIAVGACGHQTEHPIYGLLVCDRPQDHRGFHHCDLDDKASFAWGEALVEKASA